MDEDDKDSRERVPAGIGDEDRMYRLAMEQTRDYALFMLDTGGHVRTWNAGAERIKGYSREEIVGRHFSTFYPPDAIGRGWPQHELKMAAMEGRFEDEGWRVRKDGSRFWANVVITALRGDNGRLLGFAKITRDLTRRREHEEALRQSEERFRLLVEGVHEYAIYMLDPLGVVSSWNSGAERILGYDRAEIIGKHFSRFYPAVDIEDGKPWEELAAARRRGSVEDEGWRQRRNGERFWARVVVTALHDGEGRLRGFAKLTQDLTQHRQMRSLEKAAENVNEFIATLAHELRNPLAPIRNAVQLLAHVPADSPMLEAIRQTIDRQSAHLSRIVDDMVDISRITRGAMQLQREPVGLGEVVRQAVEAGTPAIEAADHRLEVGAVPADLVVRGDRQRLVQVLTNLLDNAARYTPKGGRISLDVDAQDGFALARVRDTGRGIEPEMLERIFDMFVQGRSALQRVGGGMGIGLAIARKIAEGHDGSLEARSEGTGRGSEFTLKLPLVEGAPVAPSAGRAFAPTPSAGAPARVLVVDDNVDAAAALAMLLRSLGHETRVAHDGTEALELAPRFEPDVVLLDIGMPGLDGFEVARRLREAETGTPMRIVAVTGWGQELDRQRSREAGFDIHLVKPVDAEVLERVIGERDAATLH